MLKIVVFDGGFGGELLADKLSDTLQVVEIIRVIDWRNANSYISSKRVARTCAMKALRPYIGRVDLIILANQFLTITSLKFFKRRFRNQKFVGTKLKIPDDKLGRDTLVLTTKAVARTIKYYNYLHNLHCRTKTITPDSWLAKIDDGILTDNEIATTCQDLVLSKDFSPKVILLDCTHYSDIKLALKKVFGNNTKICDAFDDTIREACKALKLRGGTGKKHK